MFECPLNEAVKGVFFGCNNEHNMGFKHISSPYGDVRLVKPLSNFKYHKNFNFYFADFYYTSGSPEKMRYIAVCAAVENTIEDYYCKDYLVALDKFDNPFFSLNRNGSSATCPTNAWVYMYHLGDVTIKARLEDINTKSKGEHFITVGLKSPIPFSDTNNNKMPMPLLSPPQYGYSDPGSYPYDWPWLFTSLPHQSPYYQPQRSGSRYHLPAPLMYARDLPYY